MTIYTGDLLYRDQGVYQHVGVHLGNGQVLQNTRSRGEHLTDVESFGQGKAVKVKRTAAHPLDVSRRAQIKLQNPKSYDLLTNNCEHTATYVAEGRATSPQLMIFSLLALVGLFLILKTKS